MKKLLSTILSLAILLMAFPASALAYSEEDMFVDNIVYDIYDYHWEGNKMYVQGCIANLNTAFDLVGLQDAVMVLTDSNGLELCYINLNDDFEENCLLRPMSKRPYNFTVPKLLYDREMYSRLTSGLQVFFVSFSCNYAECEGANCPYCRNTGLDLYVNPFSQTSSGASSDQGTPCYMCRNGNCVNCGGSGVYEPLKGSIWGGRCRTCEGNGKCPACGGDCIIGN